MIAYVTTFPSDPGHLTLRTGQSSGAISFIAILFHSLVFAAGYDADSGPGNPCKSHSASSKCVIQWAGGKMTVSSIVLLASSLGFGVSIDAHSISN